MKNFSIERENKNKDYEGVGLETLVEPTPSFNQAKAERVIKGQNNTFIVLGRDRPADRLSGYGGAGKEKSGAIDIVVGRVSSLILEEKNGKKQVVENSIPYDAARITISQRTDVDENFYLADGKVGARGNCSAIILKADNLRFVAREGIKIVTGIDNYDSNGRRKVQKYGIDLIANNNDEELQPLVKGHNLREFLDFLIEKVAKNNSEIATLHKMLVRLSVQLGTHIHASPVGPTSPSPNLAAEAIFISSESTAHIIDATLEQVNLTNGKLTYLLPANKDYILSKYNNTN